MNILVNSVKQARTLALCSSLTLWWCI